MKTALDENVFITKQGQDSLSSLFSSALSSISGDVSASFKEEVGQVKSDPVSFLTKALEEGAILKIVHKYCGGFLGDAIYLGLKALGLDFPQIINGVIGSLLSGFSGGKIDSMTVRDTVARMLPSAKQSSREARRAKLAQAGIAPMEKTAGLFGTTSFVLNIFTWLVSAILWGVGLLTAEGTAAKYFGASNYGAGEATSDLPSHTEPAAQTPSMVTRQSSQEVLPLKPGYVDLSFGPHEYYMYMKPTFNNIAGLLLKYTYDVYDIPDNCQEMIENNPEFQQTVQALQEANITKTSSITMIPQSFKSKKSIVDVFIDSVAADLLREGKIAKKDKTQ